VAGVLPLWTSPDGGAVGREEAYALVKHSRKSFSNLVL
jgi:hypothetical protein